MASYVTPKKNAAYTFYTGLISQADIKLLQVNPTLAAGDVKVATDDGAPANIATLPAVDADFTRRIKVELSAAEMNGDNVTIIFSDAADAEWCDLVINIQTTTRQIDDLAYPTVSGRSMDVDADGGVEIGALGAGSITAATFGAGAIDAAAIAADAGAELAAALLDLANGIDTGFTLRQVMRGVAAVLLGKSSANGNTFRDLPDTKNRIVGTVDANYNRTAVTRDLT